MRGSCPYSASRSDRVCSRDGSRSRHNSLCGICTDTRAIYAKSFWTEVYREIPGIHFSDTLSALWRRDHKKCEMLICEHFLALGSPECLSAASWKDTSGSSNFVKFPISTSASSNFYNAVYPIDLIHHPLQLSYILHLERHEERCDS